MIPDYPQHGTICEGLRTTLRYAQRFEETYVKWFVIRPNYEDTLVLSISISIGFIHILLSIYYKDKW